MKHGWLRSFYNMCLVGDSTEELEHIEEGTSSIVERISPVLDILSISMYEISRRRYLGMCFRS